MVYSKEKLDDFASRLEDIRKTTYALLEDKGWSPNRYSKEFFGKITQYYLKHNGVKAENRVQMESASRLGMMYVMMFSNNGGGAKKLYESLNTLTRLLESGRDAREIYVKQEPKFRDYMIEKNGDKTDLERRVFEDLVNGELSLSTERRSKRRSEGAWSPERRQMHMIEENEPIQIDEIERLSSLRSSR